jgi:uncharacterized protein (TIGR03118 family)
MNERLVKRIVQLALISGTALLYVTGCGDDNDTSATHPPTVSEVDLVSNRPGAATTDSNLVNAWGIAISPNGTIWVSDNHSGVTTTYDGTGKPVMPTSVTIPAPPGVTGPAAPTGMVFNDTSDFGGDKFIFATEDGTIAGWQSGSSAQLRADNSGANAVYKGIALANTGSGNFLYATNFHNGTVDIFDASYHAAILGGTFSDPQLPAGFAPFNIGVINGKLYVTYAKQDDMKHDDMKGPGNGYIDVFDTNGVLQRRFASQGALNSPWGLALAPSDFDGIGGDLLVGNFGNGHISVFNPNSGAFLGQLEIPSGQPLVIDGLWALVFANDTSAGSHDTLLFSAGPNGENDGLFGKLTPAG